METQIQLVRFMSPVGAQTHPKADAKKCARFLESLRRARQVEVWSRTEAGQPPLQWACVTYYGPPIPEEQLNPRNYPTLYRKELPT